MAYSVKYLFKFESSNGTTREIRVLQDGYTGEVIQRPLGRAPVLKKQQNGPVHGTSLEFYAECNVDREFIEFYTSDPKAYRVDLYAGATLLWQGYITPELYSEPDIAPPYDVQVVATDGVGELKLYNYAAQGTVTLRTLLSGLLSRTGLGTDIYLISSLKPGSAGAGSLLEKTINLDYMAGNSCYETLTYILDTLHATITWWKGAWILTRETNVTFTSGKVRYFNTAGNSALLADSVQVLGKMYANPAWPVGQLSTVIDPAKNRVTVQAPWHVVTCLRNSDMSSDANWTKAKNARYETDGYVLPVNINTGTSETAVISQATSMAGLRVPMSLSVKATGATSEISAQAVGAVLGVLLTYKVGNVTYHLVKGDDGAPVWQQGDDIGTYIPLRTRVDFQQPLATWDSSRIEAEELTIDNIPPFLQGTSFPAGTLTVYILGYCAKIYGAYLDVVLPKGYQDILRIDNGARGEGSEVEIAIGRETTDNAYYAAFLQGLLLDTGNLITSFSDANFPGGMDYLAFIARDYALSVALPRAKVTGTVYLESGITVPPLVFTKGALNYWLQTWSWNLYDDELEIDALTLPSAQLTVLSETILEANGSTVSSSSGAGSAGGGSVSMTGGGTNYFEPNTDLQTIIQLKSAYDYLGVRDGLFFTGGDTSTPTPDLYVDTVNNQRVLRSPLPLITGGDQIVIDGEPGGGGSGGASNLYQLEDVSVASRANGDVLYYDGSKWVNKPASEIGGVTSVAGQTGAVTTAQIATALTGAGYKLTDTVITDYWKTGDSRTKNTVLAAPSSANGAASFRALVAADIPSLAISKITNLQTTLDGKQATISDLATIRSNAANGQSAYNALGNYVLKAGDTMTGDLIIEKTGGGLTIRGARLNANGDGGYIYLAARYFNHARNGVKIAAVYPGTGAYDIQDLVFYSSRNVDPDSDASPIWEESMRIKSTKAVSIAASLAIGTTLSVTGATTLSSTLGVTGLATLTGGAVIPSAKTLKIGDATISWVENSGNGYLHIDKPLVTAGDQIVISGTPGEGGGGGKSRLSELLDVDKSISVGANKLLVYSTSVTSNAGTSGGWTATALSAGTGISVSGLAISLDVAGAKTALGLGSLAYKSSLAASDIPSITVSKISDIGSNYVSLATAQTITAKHTFSNGLILNTASSWTSSDRALYFAAHDDDTNLRYYYTDASKGLTFNPNTGALKAGSFVKRGGTSSQFLKANGSVDENVYLTGITSSMVTTALGYTPVPNTRTVNGKQLSANVTLSLDDIGNGTTRSLANYLPLAGGTMTGGITFANRTYLNWTSVDGSTNYNILGVNNTDNLLIGYGLRTVSGSTTTLYGGDSVNLSVGGSTIASVTSTGLDVDGLLTTKTENVCSGSGYQTLRFLSNASSAYIQAKPDSGNAGDLRITGYNAQQGNALYFNFANIYAQGPLSVTGDLTASGAGSFDTITLTNTGAVAHVNFSRANWNYVNIPTGGTLALSVGGAGTSNTAITVDAYRVKPGSNSTVNLGYVDTSSASNNRLWANIYGEHFELVKTGGATLTLRGTTLNNQRHTILFQGSSSDSNGFKIETTAASSYGRQSLGFYTSNVTSGSAPYTPVWKRALYIPYSGGVTIGTSSYNCNLTVYGAISSTGDQTVTSDALLKKNWRALRYGVKDIAGATAGVFDWKDGKGSSAGTKAQDWLRLVPELVHGEEGHMSLAYGQIAMLNTILIAREVVDHEAEIQKLKRRVAELENQLNLRS